MSDITYSEYWKEIKDLAENITTEAMENNDNDREEAEEAINDHILHETVDGHQWVIYYNYSLDVVKHSDNEDYMVDNFGSEYAGDIMKDQGLDSLHSAIAFWCMYADIQDCLSDALDAVEEAQS